MKKNAQDVAETKSQKSRLSVSLPPELHAELERIAASKKVSLAWVIRDAAELYISSKYPLLDGR